MQDRKAVLKQARQQIEKRGGILLEARRLVFRELYYYVLNDKAVLVEAHLLEGLVQSVDVWISVSDGLEPYETLEALWLLCPLTTGRKV